MKTFQLVWLSKGDLCFELTCRKHNIMRRPCRLHSSLARCQSARGPAADLELRVASWALSSADASQHHSHSHISAHLRSRTESSALSAKGPQKGARVGRDKLEMLGNVLAEAARALEGGPRQRSVSQSWALTSWISRRITLRKANLHRSV